MVKLYLPGEVNVDAGDVLGITVSSAGGDPAELGLVGAHFARRDGSGGPAQPLLWAALTLSMAGSIGRIIVNWSVADWMFTEVTALLLAHNKVAPAHWRQQETAKRFRLHQEQFGIAFGDFPDLLKHHSTFIMNPAWKAKQIRDLLGHSQIVSTTHKGQPALRFITDRLGKKHSNYITEEQLELMAFEISRIAGSVSGLIEDHELIRASPQSISALQRALDKDRWNAAIDKGLERRQR